MGNIELLDICLKERRFQEATTLALARILPEARWPAQQATWERLIDPRQRCTVDDVTVSGCPLLLGCLQVVSRKAAPVLEEWRTRVTLDPHVASFFQKRQERLAQKYLPASLPDGACVQAILACAEAALAAQDNDTAALLQHGYRAAQWFAEGASEEITESADHGQMLESTHSSPKSINECFAVLAEGLQIPTARARELTHWLVSQGRDHALSHTQRMVVPFYEHKGAIATLEMELVEGRGEFYTDPVAMAFTRWDKSFKKAYENAQAYIRQLGYWREDVDVRWRMQANPPLFSLTGGSAGGAFFANLWHLLTGTPSDVSVTISASIDANGHVQPVDHIWDKIHALLAVPTVSGIIVAEGQNEVQEGRYDRLQIWKVRQAGDPEKHGRRSEG